jgi:hypothetical protein
VVTIGTVRAGSAPNVIAEQATLEGTIRTTLPDVRDHPTMVCAVSPNGYAICGNAKFMTTQALSNRSCLRSLPSYAMKAV